MQQNEIVLLQSDPRVIETLSGSLNNSFHGVHVTQSVDELRHSIAKHRPQVMIVDLESAGYGEVAALRRDFSATRIVCNHRVADEEMWTRTLTAGADDFCPSSDTRAILAAVRHDASQRIAA